ncbi:MAG: ammonium transporter [Proteobacteria bacterium]|nr:ammonium transporter [Pseudomonadota bacterium]
MKPSLFSLAAVLLALLCFFTNPALAQEVASAPPPLDSGSTAWMLTSTLLVLMMTIPGLALFYGGMVHKESVLAALMQCFVATTVVTVLWVFYGYSMIFTPGNGFIGGFGKLMLAGVYPASQSGTAPALIPETVFIMFQMTFGIITCALIFGSVATRIHFSAALAFIAIWFTLVYVPVAHWVWGPAGMLGGVGVDGHKGLFGFGPTLDYAGGTVVHINAGIAGLMASMLLGNRKGFGQQDMAPPYNIVFSVIGASLLWVGWFGFNAGSAIAAGASAGMAMLVTHIASASASLAWMSVEWFTRGKPSVIGIISGAVAGLVSITPASGFVGVGGALIIGAVAGVLCFWACGLKFKFGFDDSLDVFGVHCVGGIAGALLTGIFADKAIGGQQGSLMQFLAQCEGVLITVVYCAVMSFLILKFLDLVIGLRVDEATEHAGLDMAIHGEKLH